MTEDIPNNMMHDLLGAVHDERADILGMICPTCFGQFDHGKMKIAKLFEEDFHTPPVYYFQLLALAQGGPYEKLGFKNPRFKSSGRWKSQPFVAQASRLRWWRGDEGQVHDLTSACRPGF